MKNMLQFISKKEYLSKWNLNKIIQSLHLTHSIPLVSFYIPWKHQKPDVFWYFQVYRKRPVAWNGLTLPLTFWNFLKNKENGHGRVISKIWQISIFFWKLLHISKSTGSKVTFFEYIKNSNDISNICYHSTTEIE